MKKKLIIVPLIAFMAISLLLVFSPGLACTVLIRMCSLLDDHAKIACSIADVATIPKNAENLKSWGWSTGFSNQSRCVFKLNSKEQVEEWIKNSPSLKEQQPFLFTPSHRLITFSSVEEKKTWEEKHPDCFLHVFPLPDSISVGATDYHFSSFEDVNDFYSEIHQDFNEVHFASFFNDPKWFKPNITQGRYLVGNYISRIFIDDVNNVVWISASSD